MDRETDEYKSSKISGEFWRQKKQEVIKMAAEITAIIIFLLMFILIVLDRWEHYIITLCCALGTIILVFGIEMRDGAALLQTLNVSSSADNEKLSNWSIISSVIANPS